MDEEVEASEPCRAGPGAWEGRSVWVRLRENELEDIADYWHRSVVNKNATTEGDWW